MKKEEKPENKDFSIDRLVIFCAAELEARKVPLTFENLVVECFRRFPKKFSLQGFPEYPDSARVNKSWLRCRTDFGWLVGNPKRGFKLTDAGILEAKNVAYRLGLEHGEEEIGGGCKSIIKRIRSSIGFKRYSSGDSTLDESHIANSIGVTLETTRVRVREQLRFAQRCAEKLGDEQIMAYLRFCEATLPGLKRRGSEWKNYEGKE